MKTYAWRFKDEMGVVIAKDMHNLFWAIDSVIDPHCVEIKKINYCNINFKVTTVDDELDIEFDNSYSELDSSIFDEKGWKKIDWSKYREY